MSSVTSSGVSGSASQQSARMALLVKLFQTSGKSAQDSKKDPAQGAASPPPPPPPPPPAQSNSAAGLASMFQGLQGSEQGSVSDLMSRLLQAVDTNGDGTISADELQVASDLATGDAPSASQPAPSSPLMQHVDANGDGLLSAKEVASGSVGSSLSRDFDIIDSDSDGQLSQTELNQFEANLQKPSDPAMAGGAQLAFDTNPAAGQTTSAYEALFQAMQLVFASTKDVSATTGSQRYTELLQSLARAG